MYRYTSIKFILVLLLVAAINQEGNGQEIIHQDLTPDIFQKMIGERPNAVLLDVRTDEEVSKGYISNAVHIDYNNRNFKKKVAALDTAGVYFVYCAAGGRSAKAIAIMKSLGFKELYNLSGGFNAWTSLGLPVQKNDEALD